MLKDGLDLPANRFNLFSIRMYALRPCGCTLCGICSAHLSITNAACRIGYMWRKRHMLSIQTLVHALAPQLMQCNWILFTVKTIISMGVNGKHTNDKWDGRGEGGGQTMKTNEWANWTLDAIKAIDGRMNYVYVYTLCQCSVTKYWRALGKGQTVEQR